MVCPECGRELTRENVSQGLFLCKCGWRDDRGEFRDMAKSASVPADPDDEWLPDTNSTLLH